MLGDLAPMRRTHSLTFLPTSLMPPLIGNSLTILPRLVSKILGACFELDAGCLLVEVHRVI